MAPAPSRAAELLDRIARLLDKAEATPYEAEAQALVAKASELAIRHTIATTDIDAARQGRDGDEPIEVRDWQETGVYRLPHIALLSVVAAAHHAQVLRMAGRRGDTVHLIGFHADLEVIQVLYASLRVQAASALARWWTELREDGSLAHLSDTGRRRARRGFLDGYTDRIRRRLAESRQLVDREHGPQTALVLADRSRRIEAYVSDRFHVRRARRRTAEAGSYAAGDAAASGAELGAAALDGSRPSLPDGRGSG